MPGHALAYDQETGFGLVQALGRLNLPALPLGRISAARESATRWWWRDPAAGTHSVAARIAAKQEFAGYWEYLLEEALFTAPAHPNWGGTAVIDQARQSHRHRLAASCSRRATTRRPSISTWWCRSIS